MSRQILNGWKEISNYLERGVRTAQRWEAMLGMPVHRPALRDRSAVVAFSDELDRWISRTGPDARDTDTAAPGESTDTLLRIHENMDTLAWQTSELASRMSTLQEQLRQSLDRHRRRMASRAAFRPRHSAGREGLFS